MPVPLQCLSMQQLSWLIAIIGMLVGCSGQAEPGVNADDERSGESATDSSLPSGAHSLIADCTGDLSASQLLKLLPKAAGINRKQFALIVANPPISFSELKSQPLTVLLLAIDPLEVGRSYGRVEVLDGFRYLTNPPADPDEILAAVSGDASQDFVTILQPEMITQLRCRSEGDLAVGTVEFGAEDLFAGRAEFTARQLEQGWTITEFAVPELELTTRRQTDGTWRLTSDMLLPLP